MTMKSSIGAQKMLSNTRTDVDREVLRTDSAKVFEGYILDREGMEREFLKTATPKERKTFDNAATWFDGMRSYFLKAGTMPLVFDLRRGSYEAAICYVNSGANDFNNAEENHGLCPSIIIASRIHDKNVREEDMPHLNDLLYIYRKLKEDSRGLNHEMIAAYEKKHPESKITERLAKMDALLAVPEAERFTSDKGADSKNEGLTGKILELNNRPRRSFWGRILGRRR